MKNTQPGYRIASVRARMIDSEVRFILTNNKVMFKEPKENQYILKEFFKTCRLTSLHFSQTIAKQTDYRAFNCALCVSVVWKMYDYA